MLKALEGETDDNILTSDELIQQDFQDEIEEIDAQIDERQRRLNKIS